MCLAASAIVAPRWARSIGRIALIGSRRNEIRKAQVLRCLPPNTDGSAFPRAVGPFPQSEYAPAPPGADSSVGNDGSADRLIRIGSGAVFGGEAPDRKPTFE